MISGVPLARGRGDDRASPLVLVVNSDAVTLEALQLTLEFEGFAVHQAPAPAPALALLNVKISPSSSPTTNYSCAIRVIY